MTPHELRQAAAAMQTILQAGRCAELDDRLAAAHQAERDRRNERSIGGSLNLEIELKRSLHITTEQAKAAVNQLLNRGATDVALEALLQFAAELSAPPATERRSRIRPIEEVRATWNPHGDPDDMPSSERPASRPTARRPAAPSKRRLA